MGAIPSDESARPGSNLECPVHPIRVTDRLSDLSQLLANCGRSPTRHLEAERRD